jgi:pimeloyl-ACP methyl ester carboxylesterase
MKNSLRSAELQKKPSGAARADQHARHRHQRPRRVAKPRRGTVVRLMLLVAAAVLLAGAGYLVTYLAAAPGQHPAVRASSVRHASASPAPSASTIAPLGRSGEYPVAEQSFTFTEQTATLGARTLPVLVRYPEIGQPAATATPPATVATSAGRFPLVVFAPGYRQCGVVYGDLLTQWASAGYVVAVVDFPETNCQTTNPNESDLIHQPQDVATVIAQLDALSEQTHGALTGLIDASRVAVAGHSDGGDTVAAMAAMSCCRYPGLRAAIVLAGAEWPGFAGSWFATRTPPMLFVQGTADTWNPQAASMQLYQADSTGVRYYLQLPGADHFAPYEGDEPPEPIVAQVTIDFLDQFVAGSGDESAAMQSAGNVPGVAELASSGVLP